MASTLNSTQRSRINSSSGRVKTLPLLHLPGNGIAQILRSPGDRVLIYVARDRLLRRFFDFAWSRKIRKSLRQVDRAILHCLARHFADHRLSEVRDLAAEKRL